jgi:hypothetical protein
MVYHLPDVGVLEGSAGVFAWSTSDARSHLFHVASARRATLLFLREADGVVVHLGDAVELLGSEPERAALGLVCRVGSRRYPFALCRDRFGSRGLLRAILSGSAVEPDAQP